MSSIIDKFLLLIISSITLFIDCDLNNAIYYIILMVGLSSLSEYLKGTNKQIVVLVVYIVCVFFFPQLINFFALILYDNLENKKFYLYPLFIVAILLSIGEVKVFSYIVLVLSVLVAIVEKLRTDNFIKQKSDFIFKRDFLAENKIYLEHKVDLLLSKQDTEIQLATLNERNRIAREIHDTVGHLLTSSILQLGAIMTKVKDKDVADELTLLKGTISEGMNSVRHSIHNLRDKSIDMVAQISKMVSEFNFCKIEFKNGIKNTPNIKAQYAIIGITKEALSNVINHSNASNVVISLNEHPKIYQLIISDNGTKKISEVKTSSEKSYGMGLENIRHRVSSLNGYFGINSQKGFEIFISFPKEESE